MMMWLISCPIKNMHIGERIAMNKKSRELLLLTTRCIEICVQKLQNPNENDECSENHILDVIIPDMVDLSRRALTGNLPPKESANQFSMSFAYAFKSWGWDINNPSELFSLLREINDLYSKL